MQMKNWLITVLFSGIIVSFGQVGICSATQLYFSEGREYYDYGDTLTYELYADIDSWEGILGFNFDLSFDRGTSYVSGPSSPGSDLTEFTFSRFSVSDRFNFGSMWDDGDTISGMASFNDIVFGEKILLGTFTFLAPASGALGIQTITLGAPGIDDLFSPDGLIGLGETYMPNMPSLTVNPFPVNPVPEPGTVLLLASGLAGLAVIRGRKVH